MPTNAADKYTVRPWVHAIARWMDSKFSLPGTRFRFGLDPLIGIIPVVGDTATLLIGAAMFGEAARLRAPPGIYVRMAGHLILDWLVGLIPGIDLIADTAVKAHSKNAELLMAHAFSRRQQAEGSRTNRGASQPVSA